MGRKDEDRFIYVPQDPTPHETLVMSVMDARSGRGQGQGPQQGGEQVDTHGDNQRRRDRAEEKGDERDQQPQQPHQQRQQQSGQQSFDEEFQKVIDPSSRSLPDTRVARVIMCNPSHNPNPNPNPGRTSLSPIIQIPIPLSKYLAFGCFDQHCNPILPVKGVIGNNHSLQSLAHSLAHSLPHDTMYAPSHASSSAGMRGGNQKAFTHWLQMLEFGAPATHTPDATKPHKVRHSPCVCLCLSVSFTGTVTDTATATVTVTRHRRFTSSTAISPVMCRSAVYRPHHATSCMAAGQSAQVTATVKAKRRVQVTVTAKDLPAILLPLLLFLFLLLLLSLPLPLCPPLPHQAAACTACDCSGCVLPIPLYYFLHSSHTPHSHLAPDPYLSASLLMLPLTQHKNDEWKILDVS